MIVISVDILSIIRRESRGESTIKFFWGPAKINLKGESVFIVLW
jgi:hypothetical protein